jgi:hypothetical protein
MVATHAANIKNVVDFKIGFLLGNTNKTEVYSMDCPALGADKVESSVSGQQPLETRELL